MTQRIDGSFIPEDFQPSIPQSAPKLRRVVPESQINSTNSQAIQKLSRSIKFRSLEDLQGRVSPEIIKDDPKTMDIGKN